MANTEKSSAFDPTKVKVVKNVTLPVLSLKAGETAYVRIDTKIAQGKELTVSKDKKSGEENANEKPADICQVTNLASGEQLQFIVSAVVKANIEDQYPAHTYVGKSFRIAKLEKRAGKRYFDFNIAEIEV
jgi:hypothetical protein